MTRIFAVNKIYHTALVSAASGGPAVCSRSVTFHSNLVADLFIYYISVIDLSNDTAL